MIRILYGFLLLFLFGCTGVVEEYNKVLNESRAEEDILSLSSITYSGDSLANISFPLGGIGTGSLYLGGRGNIFKSDIPGWSDNAGRLSDLFRFFLRTETTNGSVELRVLEGNPGIQQVSPEDQTFSLFSGITRFRNCSFRSEYPFAYVSLTDPASPVSAVLEAWSPFIPLDDKNSSLPVAVFNWTLTNTTSDTLTASILLGIQNPFSAQNKKAEGIISYYKSDSLAGVRFVQETPPHGELLVLSKTPSNIRTLWLRGNPADVAEVFWRDFYPDGLLNNHLNTHRFGANNNDFSSVNRTIKLLPGEKVCIPFYVNWMVFNERTINPDRVSYQLPEKQPSIPINLNNTPQLASYFIRHLDYLYSSSSSFRNNLFSSSYPIWVIDALSSNTTAIKTHYPLQNAGNSFNSAISASTDDAFSPVHWHSAISLSFLFPELAKQRYPFLYNPADLHFESMDSKLMSILEIYGQWKYSGNSEALSGLWPTLKSRLDYSVIATSQILAGQNYPDSYEFNKNDTDRKAVNAFGVYFHGSEMYTLSLYLAALKAGAELAEVMNDGQVARDYNQKYYLEKARIDDLHWNGEYYIQLPGDYELNPSDLYNTGAHSGMPKYQTGKGCFSGQLAGQFFADVYGLGDILDTIRIKQTLKSVYRYNYIRDFSGKSHFQRVYAVGRESGLVLCSWPSDDRPLFAFPYSYEVWSGLEYQVAASLIYHGMTSQGLDMIKSVRERHRGYNRNPLSESGPPGNSIRAMSSWAILTALSGYNYNSATNALSFSPALNHRNFRTFWSTSNAWGSFHINGKGLMLKVAWGSLTLNEFGFTHPDGTNIVEMVPANGSLEKANNNYTIKYSNPITLKAGEQLLFTLE